MTNTGYESINFVDKHSIPYEWDYNNNFDLLLSHVNVIGANALRSIIPVIIRKENNIFKKV